MWPGPLEGVVLTRYGHALPCERIEILEASHPVPDDAGERAARRILDLARGLGPDDQLVFLASGGGSALLALPAPGLTLADKQAVTRALLRSGATIGEINTVRKHLSAIKGGRLAAAAAPARRRHLGDFRRARRRPGGDRLGPDGARRDDVCRCAGGAREIPHRRAARRLSSTSRRRPSETPKPGDPIFRRARFELIASPQDSLKAAAAEALRRNVTPIVLSDRIEGEARDVALVHAAIARQLRAGEFRVGDRAVRPPAVLLSGGETTVTVRGKGRGGRNVEFLLALTVALDGADGIAALACDTDGIDGTEDNAGRDSLSRTASRGPRRAASVPTAALADNDGYGFFAALGDLVVTGPTLTNVNDFRAILVTA